jgi:hypothetical protein
MASSILDNYLIPNPSDHEVVILSDSEMNTSVVASRSNTIVLSAEATKLLYSAFVGAVPAKLRDIIDSDPGVIEDAACWIRDSKEEGLFGLSEIAPSREISAPASIEAGSYIAVTDFYTGHERGVPVEYPGKVTKSTFRDTIVYWFMADISVGHTAMAVEYAGISTRGPFGYSLFPKPVSTTLGANCNLCALCGGCGACGACALCGGVNFGVAVLATVAVDATLAAINAASSFAVLRERQ